jgi:hypothetical protein
MVIALPVFLERISGLLPEETKHLPQQEPFEISFLLNFDYLCEDFHENFGFRSSEVLSNRCLYIKEAYCLSQEISSQQVSMLYIIVLRQWSYLINSFIFLTYLYIYML